MEHAADEQDGAIFLTAAFTGLRAGELRALRCRRIDWADSLIHVERSYTDEGGEHLPKSWKVRSTPLMSRVAVALKRLRERERYVTDDDLVFVTADGEWIDRSALYRRYKDVQTAANLAPIRFHDLRHTFATMAIRTETNVDVQTWLGHADIATTRKYLHYAPQAGAAARLGALVGRRWPKWCRCAGPPEQSPTHARGP